MSSDYDHVRAATAAVLTRNQHTANGFRYTKPSRDTYPYQWLWDSCFHAIIYTHLDHDYAKDELRAVLAKQWPDGMVAHVTYWEPSEIFAVDWGKPETSSLTQPPLIAYALWRVYEVTNDTDLVAELYPKLARYHTALWEQRRLKDRDLLGIINPDESGEDNSPRFDTALELTHTHHVEDNLKKRHELFAAHRACNYEANRCTHEHFWVEDVPFNVFAIASLEAMQRLAVVSGNDPSPWRRHAKAIAHALRTHCFANGSFWSTTGEQATRIETDTWARFAPLFIGLYTQSEATALVTEHLRDETRYSLPYGLPTVAATNPSYDPNEPTWGEAWQHPHWRGPIWMLPHWCVYHGLQRYGFVDDAKQLRDKSIRLLQQSGYREYFHPETGIGMGAQGFTWGGLVLDMFTA